MHRPRTRISGRQGHALLTTLCFAVVIAAVGAAILTLASQSHSLAFRRAAGLQALNLATAGADEAVSQFRGAGNYLTDGQTKTWTVAGDGGGDVRLSAAYRVHPDPAVDEPICEVTSTGTVNAGPLGRISRAVTVVLGQGGTMPPAFLKAMVAKTDIQIKGKVWTTSQPTSGEGDIWANRYLKFKKKYTPMTIDPKSGKRKGGYRIDGDADSGMGIYGSTAGVRGRVRSGRKAISFPKVTKKWIGRRVGPRTRFPGNDGNGDQKEFRFGDGKDFNAASGKWEKDDDSATADTDDILAGGTYVLPEEANGPRNGKEYKLQVEIGKQGVTIPAGAVVHIKGNLKVRGPVRGQGTLIVEGKIDMDAKDYKGYTATEKAQKSAWEQTLGKAGAQAKLNGEWMKQEILFISNRGPRGKKKPEKLEGIRIRGGAKYLAMKGVFYAPNSAIKIKGKTQIHGSVVGNFIKASGEPKIIADRTIKTGPVPPFVDVLAWDVL